MTQPHGKSEKPGPRGRPAAAPRAPTSKPRVVDRRAASAAERNAAPDSDAALAPDDRIVASNLTLHELFAQQTTRMLERADLSEEQKQSILIGMAAPAAAPADFRSPRS